MSECMAEGDHVGDVLPSRWDQGEGLSPAVLNLCHRHEIILKMGGSIRAKLQVEWPELRFAFNGSAE